VGKSSSRKRSRTADAPARAAFVESLEARLLLANRIHGVDVSQFQGTMNWDAAWNQNVRFAYVRASRTGLGEDTLLDTNAPSAKTRGILTGAYHHVSPILNGEFTDPTVDANVFIASAIQYMQPGYLRPMVDVEEDFDLNSNGYDIRTWTAAFANHIHDVIGVMPVLYTLGGYAESVFDASTVALLPDGWPAIHFAATDPVTTTSQPMFNNQIGTGVWRTSTPTPEESWAFWQYSGDGNGKGPLYGAVGNPAIDLNVFNGDSIDVLKERFVIGAAKIPTLLSPLANGSLFPNNGTVFDWTDSPGAVAYDVYLDNMTTPVATNLTQSQWTAGMMVGGAHSWRVVAKGVLADDDTHVSSLTGVFNSAVLPVPGTPGSPLQHNIVVNAKPVVLDWADSPNAASYDVYLGTSQTPTFTNLTSSQSPAINPLDGTRLWRVVAKNPAGTTNGPQWSYTMDTTAPTASLGPETPTPLGSIFDFSVTYADAATAIDVATLGNDDIEVTGPNGFSATATLRSIAPTGPGTPRTANYRIDAPTGTWSRYDNGTYTVLQQAGSVRDTAGNARAASVIGSFASDVPFATARGSTLTVEHAPQGTPIRLAPGASGSVQVTEGATTPLTFAGIGMIVMHGSPGDDTLEYTGPIDPYTVIDGGGAGNDTLHVLAGAINLGDDLSATTPNLTVWIDGGAEAVFYTSQHLRNLIVNGSARLSPDSDYTLVTRGLSIGASGRLDVTNKDLIVAPRAGDPPQPDVQAFAASAYDFGAWDGFGLATSMPEAAAGLTTVAVAPAGAVLGLAAGESALWNGESVSAASILVKYTYAGDANLDGVIDGGDYGVIDNFVQVPGASGYFNGDFNFDGVVDGGDYGVIDNNIQAQGAAL
jgi:GH25 family lysozyme M1 (1,4-beta-N-acetylmuramidase)